MDATLQLSNILEDREIFTRSKTSLHNCQHLLKLTVATTSIESPNITIPISILEVYHDITEVLSKIRASCLFPYRSYVCTINHLPGTSPTHWFIYPLSLTDQGAMKQYVQESVYLLLLMGSSSLKRREGASGHRLIIRGSTKSY